VNAALATTDIIRSSTGKFDETTSTTVRLFGQWFKTDKPAKFELKMLYSDHDLPQRQRSHLPDAEQRQVGMGR